MTTTPPVIFIIFNRLDTAKQVFEAIKAARPKTLLVIADAPRPDRPGEADKCEATRAIIHEVDWECDVHTNFSSVNMGLCQRISSGITWAFEIVDKAIILEDDCVPDPSFFHFCADILERYEADERVMMISGNNHLFGRTGTADSYYFSRYPHVWGWATWRRAWEKYDPDMLRWPEIRDRQLFDQYFTKRRDRYHCEGMLQLVYDRYGGMANTWAWRWFYSTWANSGLCAHPARNLVRNIGFQTDATHTNTKYDSVYGGLEAEELDWPLVHPANVLASSDTDDLEARLRFKYHGTGMLGVFFKELAILVLVKRIKRHTQKWWAGRHAVRSARSDVDANSPQTHTFG